MFGLETGECDPLASAGRWTAKRTGLLLDAAARVAAPYSLIASGCHWSIPSLRGIPTEYQFVGGLDAAARLAKTLLVSRVAAADAWFQAGRDPFRFIEQTLKGWIEAHGGQEIDNDLFLRLGLVSDLDPHGQGDGEQDGGDEMFLILEPDSAGYVVLGPTLRLLETVHPRLPTTFFDLFTHALNRWVRVYDYRDAAERVQQLQEWYEGDPEGETVELPDVDGATPKCLRGKRNPLKERSVERLLGTVKNRKIRAIVEGVLELGAASRKGTRPEIAESARERLMDSNPPVPALVAVFEKHDAIEGCFDEEAQGMLECAPEPNLIVPLQSDDAESVRTAFQTLEVACSVFRQGAHLIKLMMELVK
jgi:hypothetical protein